MGNIAKEIQEKQAERKLNILKGFSDFEETFEKAKTGKYSDNSVNRKLNRVGQEYGSAKKEDVKSDNKQSKKEDTNASDDNSKLKDYAKEAKTEDLKKYLEAKIEDDDLYSKNLKKIAEDELKSRGENSDEDDEDDEELTSKFETGQEVDTEDGSGFISDVYANKDGLFIEVSYDSGKVKHYTESELEDSIKETEDKNKLNSKLEKVTKSVENLKKHLTDKK